MTPASSASPTSCAVRPLPYSPRPRHVLLLSLAHAGADAHTRHRQDRGVRGNADGHRRRHVQRPRHQPRRPRHAALRRFVRILRDLSLLSESARVDASKAGVRFVSYGDAYMFLGDTQASSWSRGPRRSRMRNRKHTEAGSAVMFVSLVRYDRPTTLSLCRVYAGP